MPRLAAIVVAVLLLILDVWFTHPRIGTLTQARSISEEASITVFMAPR